MTNIPGETTVPVGDWTTGTLKIYHDEKIASLKERYDDLRQADQIALQAALVAQEKAVAAALTAAKEAVLKAETAAEKRFESVNEFRQSLADQTATLLPRTEYDTAHKSVVEKIDGLTDRMNRKDGQSTGSDKTIAYIVTAISIGFGVVGMILAFNN